MARGKDHTIREFWMLHTEGHKKLTVVQIPSKVVQLHIERMTREHPNSTFYIYEMRTKESADKRPVSATTIK